NQGRMTGQQPPTGTQQGAPRPGPKRAKEGEKGPSQDQYPLRNLPALRDLYTQIQPDDTKLERFGAALFRNSAAAADKAPLSVAAGSDYILGPGDELIIDYWGTSSQHLQRAVDREGRISLPEAGTVVVAGHTLGETQETVRRLLSRQ